MPLAIYTSAAWTANGGIEPAAGATVEVRSEATGSLASLSEDRDGEVGLDNPFAADAQGRFAFFVAGGAYRVKVTDGENEHTLRWQAVGTAGERDVGTAPSEVPTNAEFGGPTPTQVGRGAIVESGSNSNGHYIRWENGEQVCFMGGDPSGRPATSSFNGTFVSGIVTLVPPASFDTAQKITLSAVVSADENTGEVVGRCYTRDEEIAFRMHRAESGDVEVSQVDVTAWGFWK